jgi:ubiquinone/menaquinone biosynthesis C-methylase UbiE
MNPVTLENMRDILSVHAPLYKWRRPIYQTVLVDQLREIWDPKLRTILDIGGGTGLLAHAIKTLFGVRHMAAVDVEDRFLKALDIESSVFDGRRLPFPDASFDGVTILNVLHHVPEAVRPALMNEARRIVGNGPIYIKDHLSCGWVDDLRLFMLDLLGNLPFSGMVRAKYLRSLDWAALAEITGHRIETQVSDAYRSGPTSWLFPNRLEICMKWLPLKS